MDAVREVMDDAMSTLVRALEVVDATRHHEDRVTALFDVWESAQAVVDVYYRYEYWRREG